MNKPNIGDIVKIELIGRVTSVEEDYWAKNKLKIKINGDDHQYAIVYADNIKEIVKTP